MKKRFTYINNEVKVKSEIELTEEQIKEIFSIVSRTRIFAYSEVAYIISRKIFYYIRDEVKSVKCVIKKKSIFGNAIIIKIFKR